MERKEIMAVDVNAVPEAAKVISGWINETTLYYTFSTIAQTLASAFGVLGAFALFHLNGINQSIKGTCSAIYNSSNDPSEIIRLSFSREDWRNFLNDLNNNEMSSLLRGKVTIDKESYELLKHLLESDLKYRKLVMAYIKSIIYLTAAAIIPSLIALPFVPILVTYFLYSSFFIGVTIGISIGCVYYYVQIILSAINYKVAKVDIFGATKKEKKMIISKIVENIKKSILFGRDKKPKDNQEQ